MEENKKETWLNYLAVSTVIIAVCATLSTFKGGGYSTKSMLSQTLAANQWSYFQSKSVKTYLHEIQKDVLSLEKNRIPVAEQTTIDSYDKLINEYSKKITKYEEEKKGIKKKAEAYELDRDEAQKHSKAFGLAVIFLQITILLSSIAALLKKKFVFYIGLGVGLVGILYFVDGFFLFI